jgi:hypothetical protein
VKLAYTPIGIALSLLAGQLGKKIFDLIWGQVEDQEAPRPKHREIGFVGVAQGVALDGMDLSWPRARPRRGGPGAPLPARADRPHLEPADGPRQGLRPSPAAGGYRAMDQREASRRYGMGHDASATAFYESHRDRLPRQVGGHTPALPKTVDARARSHGGHASRARGARCSSWRDACRLHRMEVRDADGTVELAARSTLRLVGSTPSQAVDGFAGHIATPVAHRRADREPIEAIGYDRPAQGRDPLGHPPTHRAAHREGGHRRSPSRSLSRTARGLVRRIEHGRTAAPVHLDTWGRALRRPLDPLYRSANAPRRGVSICEAPPIGQMCW